MSDLLKGNFKIKNTVEDTEQKPPSLEERFEREALKKLGGSIAFVAKRKVLWGDDDIENKNTDPANHE
jgi:hypothetical protein